MNFYTCSKEQLAALDKVGAATADKLLELRDEAIAGLRDPLTTQDLSNVRLKVDYWQDLINRNILDLTPPPNLLQPYVKGAEKMEPAPKLTEMERVENMVGKSLTIFFNRFDKKLTDTTEMLQSQINNLEAGINRQLNPLRSQLDDLAQTQLGEKTHRLNFESDLDQKIQDMQIRQEQKSNQKINLLAQQLSTAVEKISRAQEQIQEIQNAQQFPRELLQPDDSHFLPGPDPESTEQKLSAAQRQSEESYDDIMQRIKQVWPKNNIYSSRGSAGTPKMEAPPGEANEEASPGGANITEPSPDFEQPKSRGRPRSRKSKSGRGASRSPSSDRSLSPLPPKMQSFAGDPSKGSWSGFILKFERIAERHRWNKDKMLDRLFSSLTDKALEYAIKCKNNTTYDGLKRELKLRFDMTDEPMIARQKLVTAKQTDEETIEIYMQRILNIASDGYGEYDFKVMQQMAIEAFLRGCQNKEAASFVMVSNPSTIQDACQKMKLVIASRKTVTGHKVSFQEKLFSAQEEKRVSDLERDVREMKQFCRTRSPNDIRYDDRNRSYRYNDNDRSYRYDDRDRYNRNYSRQGRSRDRTESRRNISPSPQRSPSDQYSRKQFYNRAEQYRRYPSRSPSDSSRGGSPGGRYYPQRENSPGGYHSPRGGSPYSESYRDGYRSPGRYPSHPDRYRDGHRPPSDDRYREDRRSHNDKNRYESRSSKTRDRSPERKPDLNSDGLGAPATSS